MQKKQQNKQLKQAIKAVKNYKRQDYIKNLLEIADKKNYEFNRKTRE